MAAALTPVRSRISQMTDAPAIGGGYEVYVDATKGNDLTGTRNRREFPFATLAAAKTAAQSGDTVQVNPGPYTASDPTTWTLSKDGVNWHFENGASYACTAAISTSTQVRGIFDDNAGVMTYRVTGSGVFTMNVTEVTPGDGGGQSVWLLSTTNASTVRIEAQSINCVTTIKVGPFPQNTGKSARQSAGTVLYKIDDPNDITVSGGTAGVISHGTNLSLTCSGGTVNRLLAGNATGITCSGGTIKGAIVGYVVTASCSSGTLGLRAERIDSIIWSGGSCRVHANSCGSMNGTASSGTGRFAVVEGSNGDNEAININQSGTAVAYLEGWEIDTNHSTAATLRGGKIVWRNGQVRSTAPTGSHGTDIAIGMGDSNGVNDSDILLDNMLVRVTDSTHSCLRVYSEAPLGSTYRVKGGVYVAGSAGFWIDPEAARNITVYDTVTASRAAGSFTTVVGPGTVVVDSGVTL